MSKQTILKVDSSVRYADSQSRVLTNDIVEHLRGVDTASILIERDLGRGIEQIDQAWVEANFTPEEERTEAHNARLAFSDELISELEAADTIVIGVPIYNFGVPNVLKAWVDLVARARKTFRYTENGPVGLLTGKRAIIAVASGGTPVGSDIDFASGYMKHVLGFLGITDVTVIAAGELMVDKNALTAARQAIARIEPRGREMAGA